MKDTIQIIAENSFTQTGTDFYASINSFNTQFNNYLDDQQTLSYFISSHTSLISNFLTSIFSQNQNIIDISTALQISAKIMSSGIKTDSASLFEICMNLHTSPDQEISFLALKCIINSLSSNSYSIQILKETDFIPQEIERVLNGFLNDECFHFFSKCVTFDVITSKEPLMALLEIGLVHSQNPYSFKMVSDILRKNDLISEAISLGLLEKIRENMETMNPIYFKSLLSILTLVEMSSLGDIFYTSFPFFDILFNMLDLCNESDFILALRFIYFIVPTYWYEITVSKIVEKVVCMFENASFSVFEAIFDFLTLYCQNADIESIKRIFNSQTMNILAKAYESENISAFNLLSELLGTLINIDSEYFKMVLRNSVVLEYLREKLCSDVGEVLYSVHSILDHLELDDSVL